MLAYKAYDNRLVYMIEFNHRAVRTLFILNQVSDQIKMTLKIRREFMHLLS